MQLEDPLSQPTLTRVPKRYLVRFPDQASFDAAHAVEALPDAPRPVSSPRRHYVSVATTRTVAPGVAKDLPRARLEEDIEVLIKEFRAEVFEDFHYELDQDFAPDFFARDAAAAEDLAEASLQDVVAKVRADLVWPTTRGQGVTIAVVDTGVDGSHAEFPAAKRAGAWAPAGEDPWTDWKGHGTMCACIATATRSAGGAYEGIAPDAGLISCRTHFYDSELAAIYDYLTDRVRADDLRIVATNSFGIPTGTPPPLPTSNVFAEALADALDAGVTVVFSAGNNHELAGGSASACAPNSIWLHKSRADILAVATCSLDGRLWEYSSRGPGQFFGTDQYGPGNSNRKPDMVAPTPRNGRILYGSAERVMPRGWGTSGAAPQVAGLAALLRSVAPALGRAALFDIIRGTAQGLGEGHHCEGHGMIDCARALAALP